jgi:hypothetical protein
MKSASCITKFSLLTELNQLYNTVNFILNNRNQNRHKTTQSSVDISRCPSKPDSAPTPRGSEPFPCTQNLIHAMNKFLRQPTILSVAGCEVFAAVTMKITVFCLFTPYSSEIALYFERKFPFHPQGQRVEV